MSNRPTGPVFMFSRLVGQQNMFGFLTDGENGQVGHGGQGAVEVRAVGGHWLREGQDLVDQGA